MVPGFDPTLILWLNLTGTFVFGLSGGLAAVRKQLDVVGVVTLSAVVALAGGITRDVLIGVHPATFRDWRYLAAVGAAALVCFVARPALERIWSGVMVFDGIGLAVFCVTGATKGLDNHLGPVQAVLLGAITGVGGGLLRDVLLREIPTVLRHELYAIPALLGASVVVGAHEAGNLSAAFPALGAVLCFGLRMVGLRYGLNAPVARGEHRGGERADE